MLLTFYNVLEKSFHHILFSININERYLPIQGPSLFFFCIISLLKHLLNNLIVDVPIASPAFKFGLALICIKNTIEKKKR